MADPQQKLVQVDNDVVAFPGNMDDKYVSHFIKLHRAQKQIQTEGSEHIRQLQPAQPLSSAVPTLPEWAMTPLINNKDLGETPAAQAKTAYRNPTELLAQATTLNPQAASSRPVYMAVPKPKGLKKAGNININNRPIVQNGKESSTVLSTSFGTDQGEVLVPRVSDGADGKPPHIMSDKEAFEYYKKTGQYLGIFDTPQDATAYANALHIQQSKLGNKNGRTVPQ